MKSILLLVLLLVCGTVDAQKLKYKKNVYPLVKSGNVEAAIPMLESYLKQDPDHTNAHYWAAKFYEQKLNGPDSIANIKLAILHWQEAKRTVSVGEMMTANASKYPDIKGSATNDRLLQFTQMADGHISNLLAKEVAIKENVAKIALEKKNEEERLAKEAEKELARKKEELEKKKEEAERLAKETAEQARMQKLTQKKRMLKKNCWIKM